MLDLETGSVVKELQSPAGIKSFGLSRPGAYDADENLTTDVLMAGDLAGNLWRYDVSSADPNQWSVRHFFKTYAADADVGKQPISVMPLVMGDRVAQAPIWIFGTGKFIGEPDRYSDNVPVQAFYGVRDFAFSTGAPSVTYPVVPATLVEQTLRASGPNDSLRDLTSTDVPSARMGWRIDLKLKGGERNTLTATPLDVSQLVVLTSLIPVNNGDPCSSARAGAVMIVDASTGGAAFKDQEKTQPKVSIRGGGATTVGGIVDNPPASGSAVVSVGEGGGAISVAIGEGDDPLRPMVDSPYWHRQAWRELFNVYELNQ